MMAKDPEDAMEQARLATQKICETIRRDRVFAAFRGLGITLNSYDLEAGEILYVLAWLLGELAVVDGGGFPVLGVAHFIAKAARDAALQEGVGAFRDFGARPASGWA